MRALSAAELLEVWERGVRQHPVDRALTVLSASTGESRDELALASVGRRDALLLSLYERMAGGGLHAFAECPACTERLEYDLAVRDLLAGEGTRARDAELIMQIGDVRLRLRLLNSLDLAAAASCTDAEAAARLLAERAVIDAHYEAEPLEAASLPDAILEEAGARLAEVDPQAETLIDLACTNCSHVWQVVLDIESFLWAQINALAKRLLRDVHVLAVAYGWREADILAMSSVRRGFYLEMVS